MIKNILIKIAFNLVVEFICYEARKTGKPWVQDFCDFAKELSQGKLSINASENKNVG